MEILAGWRFWRVGDFGGLEILGGWRFWRAGEFGGLV